MMENCEMRLGKSPSANILMVPPSRADRYLARFHSIPFHKISASSTMAEAIGLAASILAIESAAEAILTVAKWMFRTAKEISGVEEDIEALAKKIDSFQSIIGAAYFALYIHYMDRDQESLSALMKDIVKRDTLRKLVAGSHMVLHQIKNLKPRIKIMRDQLSMFNKLKSLFSEEGLG
jgi:hypothetical protein